MAKGVAPGTPTPVMHLGNLCLGSPCECPEGLFPHVSVREHVYACVPECVCMHVSTGDVVTVPLNFALL